MNASIFDKTRYILPVIALGYIVMTIACSLKPSAETVMPTPVMTASQPSITATETALVDLAPTVEAVKLDQSSSVQTTTGQGNLTLDDLTGIEYTSYLPSGMVAVLLVWLWLQSRRNKQLLDMVANMIKIQRANGG